MSSALLSDDPDKLLNEWLGELENLIGVSYLFIYLLYLYSLQTLLMPLFIFIGINDVRKQKKNSSTIYGVCLCLS